MENSGTLENSSKKIKTKKLDVEKTGIFALRPSKRKSGAVLKKNLSVPFERRLKAAQVTQVSTFNTQRLREDINALEILEFVKFSFLCCFCSPVARQPRGFGQNPSGKVLKFILAYFG